MADSSKELIFKLLKEKVFLKEDVIVKTQSIFDELKSIIQKFSIELNDEVRKQKQKVLIQYNDKGKFEAELTIADDLLVFLMHSNIFTFEANHEIWKSSYVQENHNRSFCGKIDVFNFLTDSFKYNRESDVGYLIARIFINYESHFFVEGKRQLGFLYNDFQNSILETENIQKIVESTILYSLDFDPFAQPFEEAAQISVKQVIDSTLQSQIATGKRLGFTFKSDSSEI